MSLEKLHDIVTFALNSNNPLEITSLTLLVCFSISVVESEMHINRIASSIGGGHRGVHIPYLRSSSGQPCDTNVYDEMSTLRKHSFQGEARRTI